MDAIADRIWPEGLTRIPYWVYTDADVLALEQKRIFEARSGTFSAWRPNFRTSATTAPRSWAPCPSWSRAPRTVTSARSKTAVLIAGR